MPLPWPLLSAAVALHALRHALTPEPSMPAEPTLLTRLSTSCPHIEWAWDGTCLDGQAGPVSVVVDLTDDRAADIELSMGGMVVAEYSVTVPRACRRDVEIVHLVQRALGQVFELSMLTCQALRVPPSVDNDVDSERAA